MKYDISKAEKLEISDDAMRIFKAWASVEVPDKQGEIVSIEDLKKLMPVLVDRGGLIMDRHTNRPVGKILNYEIKEKNGTPGVLITAKIFDHYELDDEIWSSIKSGQIKGLSIGGRGIVDKTRAEWDEKEGKEVKRLNLSELYEISVTPNPANPEATIEAVSLAKQMQEVQKPFGKWKDFDDCVNDMKSQGYSEDSAKRICGALKARLELSDKEFVYVKNLEDGLLSKNLTEEKEMADEKKVEEVKANPKTEEVKEKDDDKICRLTEAIAAMGSKLDKIIDLLSSSSKEDEEEEEEDEEDKESEKMKKEIKEQIIKELGLTVVQTPRPAAVAPEEKQSVNKTDDFALKVAKGEVKVTLADIEKKAKEEKNRQIRAFLDSVKGGV